MLVVGFTALACVLIAKSDSLLWAVVAASPFAAGFAVAFAAQLRVPFFLPARNGDHETGGGRPLLTLNRLDRARPSWSAAWAWNLRAGAVTPSWRIFGAGLKMSLAVLISAVDGIVYHQAAPGAIAGLAGGLAVFMLALRYHPLGSPVLRTAPIGFRRGWLRLGLAIDVTDLPASLSGRQYLDLVASLRSCAPTDWRDRDLLARLGITAWLDRQIAEYSLGTRAKIAITAALIGSPPLLIFDESLNGLDPLAAWEMKSLLIELAASGRHAVLISTHVVETIPAFAIEPYSSPKASLAIMGK